MTPTSQVKRMKKNDLFSLKITDMGVDGEGIGKYDGMTFFVKDALIGDEIRARATKLKKHYGYARVEEIITPSPYRVEPQCPLHRRWGGPPSPAPPPLRWLSDTGTFLRGTACIQGKQGAQ